MMPIIREEKLLKLRAHEDGNDYLHSPAHAPVDREITAIDLDFEGSIPKDLDGVYIRNGHNPIFQPPSGRYHWFDGDGMVHATTFLDGKATYRNRMVMTAGLINEMEAGRGLYPSLRDGFSAEEGLKNSSGTDVILHNGEFKTLFSRCGQPYRLDPIDIRTLGPDDFEGEWSQGISAHSKVDERTGELIFFNYSFNTKPYMQYGVIGNDNQVKHAVEIELPGPRLPHDSWITEHYTILHDLPLFWDQELLQRGKKKLTLHDLPSRFGVIPRYGNNSDIQWFEADPTYILHTVNAWEEGDEIVAYAYKQLTPCPNVPRDTPSAKVQNYFLSFLYMTPRLCEYRFNLKTGQTRERIVDDTNAEMPGMNYRYMGRKNRYSYNTYTAEQPYFLMAGIQKWDYFTNTVADSYRLPKDKFMGQPVFAGKLGSDTEDDGYLLAYITDITGADGEIYIWAGSCIGDGPICKVKIPIRLPGGSHAYWGHGADIREAQARRIQTA